jgi:DNA-binding transcriptional MocR family regulator
VQSYASAKAADADDESAWQRPRNQSFFSMDVEGRVLRLDTFSTILSSGMRLGFVSGPTAFVKRMDLVAQAGASHCSAMSQMMVYKLLTHWKADGWEAHIKRLCLCSSTTQARRTKLAFKTQFAAQTML